MFGKTPATAGKQATKRQIERILTQDAGLSRSQARSILQNGYNDGKNEDAAIKALTQKIRGL